jgi:hypothetical protein
MTLSTNGLIGAAIGLFLAMSAYVAVNLQLRQSGTTSESAASLIRIILLADFIVLAAVGYFIGQMLD